MRVLHVTFSFPPDPPGGTELYVDALSRTLTEDGVESIVAAPAAREAAYELNGLRIRRFAVNPTICPLTDLYGGSDLYALAGFERILDEERPNLLHQHALTHACSVELMRLAKRRGLPIVFTYHTATTTCQRGTLLERGERVCDGRVSGERCTPCTLQGLGLGSAMSRLVAQTPNTVGTWLDEKGAQGRVWTALQMPGLMRRRVDAARVFLELPDQFIAPAPWVRELLQVNGVPDHRIVMSPHGLRPTAGVPPRQSGAAAPLRIVQLGRLDPAKGTELLIRSMREIPRAQVNLDIFGIVQSPADAHRFDQLRALTAGDSRIRLLPPITPAEVINTLAGYGFVAVPSQGMETGPLVVLEAHAAGVPVMGSALGGIADKVRHGIDGVLVSPYASIRAWSAAIARYAERPDLTDALRRAVRPPRSLSAVGREMAALYSRLLEVPV